MRRAAVSILVLSLVLAGCAGTAPDTAPEDQPRTAPGQNTTPTGPNGTASPETGDRPADALPAGPAPGTVGSPEQVLWRGSLERTGYVPNETVPDFIEIEHRLTGFNTGEHTAAKGSAVIVNGTILVGADTGTLYRVTMNGTVLWETDLSDATRGIHGTPAVMNGTAYIGAYDGVLYAVDLDTGEPLWETSLGDAIGGSPLVHEGLVYISVETHAPSGRIAAVDAATGELAWMDKRITHHPHSSPAIDPARGLVVVGANDGVLYAWDLTARELAWRYETDGAIKGPITIHDGLAIAGSWDHRVHAVHLANGTAAWTYETDDKVMSGAAVDPGTGTVYIGSHDGTLRALDIADGSLVWTYETGRMIVSSPTVAGDTIVVGSHDEQVHAVNRSTGERVWEMTLFGWASASPAVHDGRVVMLDRADRTPGSLWILGPTGPG